MGTPFENYRDRYPGVSGDTIRADAESPAAHVTSLQGLLDELDGDGRRVVNSIEGDVKTVVALNPQTAAGSAQALAAKGQYAVGCSTTTPGWSTPWTPRSTG